MTFVVAATWIARPGEEDAVAQAITRLVEPSRAEPGNLTYRAHRDQTDPTVFFIFEEYVDEAAFQAHLDSSHFAEHGLGNAVPRLATRERKFLTPYGEPA